MSFEEFEALAREFWEEIPDIYREGVDGVVVERKALPHPSLPEIFTLGECVTEAYPSGFGGPETTRSVVLLYYGSFRRLAQKGDFDWEEELWETLTHELQHHLEWLADDDALEAMDFAVDEGFKRARGEPFAPLFYRSGDEVAERVYRVEREYFLELEYRDGEEPSTWIKFSWHGREYRVGRPDRLGDLCFIQIEGGVDVGPADLCLVLLRRRGLRGAVRSFLKREQPEIIEALGEAEPVV